MLSRAQKAVLPSLDALPGSVCDAFGKEIKSSNEKKNEEKTIGHITIVYSRYRTYKRELAQSWSKYFE